MWTMQRGEGTSQANVERLRIETMIVHEYFKAMAEAGYSPKWINTGDKWVIYEAAMIFEADEAIVKFQRPLAHKSATLYFVYGNAPGEVLNDYTTNIDDYIEGVNELAERYC